MSAPITLTADDLRRLADTLDALTKATNAFDVDLAPYGGITVRAGEGAEHITVNWSKDLDQYVIDDWIGS